MLLLIGAGVAGGWALRRDDSGVPVRLTTQPTPSPCASTAAPAPVVLPQPQQVRLALLNGTPRNGLAKAIGDQLAARGFVVTEQANASAALAGASEVHYAPDARAAGELLTHWVIGSVAVRDPKVPRGTVEVTLGSGFHRLATPQEAAARNTPTAAPSASACG